MSNGALPPFLVARQVRDRCLCLQVRRAARALARHYDEALRPLELNNGQFSLLMSLNRPQPPTMAEVAALLAMDRTTLTASLKPLQRRGLLETLRDPVDRRSRRLCLTPQGRRLLTDALPLWRRAQAAAEQLATDVERLRAALKPFA